MTVRPLQTLKDNQLFGITSLGLAIGSSVQGIHQNADVLDTGNTPAFLIKTANSAGAKPQVVRCGDAST